MNVVQRKIRSVTKNNMFKICFKYMFFIKGYDDDHAFECHTSWHANMFK